MRNEVMMPRMGQSMEEGRVLRWLKEAGADVKRGEAIAEIETDKAVVEIEALVTGLLIEIVVLEGELVPIGTVIAYIDDGQPEPEVASAREPVPSTITSPESSVLPVSSAEARLEVQTPSSERINASPVARRLAQEHGIDLIQVKGTGSGGRIGKADIEAYLTQREIEQTVRVNASPVARRLAREHGIDLTQVKGTGPDRRIVKKDVEAWREAQQRAVPAPIKAEDVKRVPLSKIKQTTARRMVESKTSAPHFYVSMDIEMSRTLALRDWLHARGQEVSINDLILKAATIALVRYPNLNATFAGDELHWHPHINLAVAVALDEGLITPVIHNCESLSLTDLAAAAKGVIERARAGRLRPEDLDGGTFTVSNLGMFGVKHFEAIINPPQAAILTVGGVHRVPVFDAHDRMVPAQILTATLSADHRVTDGAEVARFLQELKYILEDSFGLVAV